MHTAARLLLLLAAPLLLHACCSADAPQETPGEAGSAPASAPQASAPQAPAGPAATGPSRLLRAEGKLQIQAALTPRGFALGVGDPEQLLGGDPLTCVWTVTGPGFEHSKTTQSDEDNDVRLWREWGGSCPLSSADLPDLPRWPLEGEITFRVRVTYEDATHEAAATFRLDGSPLPDGDAFPAPARKAGWTVEESEQGVQTSWGYQLYAGVLAPPAAGEDAAVEMTVSYGLLPPGAYTPCTANGYAGLQCCFVEQDKLTGATIAPLDGPCAAQGGSSVCCLRAPTQALAIYGEEGDKARLEGYAEQLKPFVGR
jgi:hypothetical protein